MKLIWFENWVQEYIQCTIRIVAYLLYITIRIVAYYKYSDNSIRMFVCTTTKRFEIADCLLFDT